VPVETLSRLFTTKIGRILGAKDCIELPGAAAGLLVMKGSPATRIRVTIGEDAGADDQQKSASE
jgi:hypothetical protein